MKQGHTQTFFRLRAIIFPIKIICFVAIFFCLNRTSLFAQNETDESAILKMDDGVSLGRDSLFAINVRFRMQNRINYFSTLDNIMEPGFEARVRRLRFRIDGFLYSTKLSYYIQLSFSRGDLDVSDGNTPNILRDAIIYYRFNKNFYIGIGQGKLPGNRQRVVSSGNLQMPERSVANQLFNIDRDYGLFAYQTITLGKPLIKLKAAITSGEGRNAVFSNTGLAYTGRLEFLPFGIFENSGDYSEGDLEYEEHLKVSLAATYSYNQRAVRSGGQIGFSLDKPVDIQTLIVDIMVKYRGWALMAELFDKQLFNRNPESVSLVNVYYGTGYNVQLSKTLKNKYEIGLRYAGAQAANPFSSDFNTRGLNLGKYLKGHRIKIQTFFGLDNRSASFNNFELKNRFTAQFQIELGI